jgi:predicted DsbA family dithiol-disulfide isomerase
VARVDVVEFTDPACPFAFSAEPYRLKLRWTFGAQLGWTSRMVVLADSGDEYEAKGFGPEQAARGAEMLSAEYGMPMDTSVRSRMAGTVDACRAVVAARRRAPDKAGGLLRALRVRTLAKGELLDEPSTIEAAAIDAGIDPGALLGWCSDPETEAELRRDRELARAPKPAALALDHKLATSGERGGRRYTCPSLEITCRNKALVAPGFQPFESYDVLFANLDPGLERRPAPESVQEVLRWAGHPVATQEVAELLQITRDEARERLHGGGVVEHRTGNDSFWSL